MQPMPGFNLTWSAGPLGTVAAHRSTASPPVARARSNGWLALFKTESSLEAGLPPAFTPSLVDPSFCLNDSPDCGAAGKADDELIPRLDSSCADQFLGSEQPCGPT